MTAESYSTQYVAGLVESRPVIVQKTLTSGEVAIVLGFLVIRGKHAGKPNRFRIYQMARAGIIPPAINADKLPCIDWRWSPAAIDNYIAGGWQAPTPLKPVPTKRRAS